MRRAAKTDENHQDIVRALRKLGASVQSLAAVGQGCPDILVGWRGMLSLLEIKDGSKPPSARKLTDDQVRWHAEWRGPVDVVYSVEDAIRAVTGSDV